MSESNSDNRSQPEDEPAVKAPASETPKNKDPKPGVKSNWEKADIILRFFGALGTAIVVGFVGFFGSSFLAERQETETNLRLYTELMSRREEADTSLRKEMFNSIIVNFLKPTSNEPPEKTVLNLELLAYNFHDSLDLEPLFKDVYKKLAKKRRLNQLYIERLQRVTREVVSKQVGMLAEAGGKLDGSTLFEDLKANPGGYTVLEEVIKVKSDPPGQQLKEKPVRIDVLEADLERQELRVRVMVLSSPDGEVETDAAFTVGFFDFPMLDNIRLADGLRCAIALNDFEQEYAEFTFVYFPSSRASLKEKPYYDEILHKLQKQR